MHKPTCLLRGQCYKYSNNHKPWCPAGAFVKYLLVPDTEAIIPLTLPSQSMIKYLLVCSFIAMVTGLIDSFTLEHPLGDMDEVSRGQAQSLASS